MKENKEVILQMSCPTDISYGIIYVLKVDKGSMK